MDIWLAEPRLQELVSTLKNKHHPRLEEARIVLCFNDSKPFKKDRLNWGATRKLPPVAKLFGKVYDFMVLVSRAVFEDILTEEQQSAFLDLRLECCDVEYIPELVDKKVKKTEFGQIVYTDEIKRNDNGEPIWKVVPLDLTSYQANVSRFGCWCQDLLSLKEVMK